MPRTLNEKEITAFREKLCSAASHLFVEKGVEGVTMRELATALGVSAMTPYRYFRDKNEILAMVRARAFARFADTLENAYNIQNTTLERAISMRDAYMRFALENPDSYRLMFDLSQPDGANYLELRSAMNRCSVWVSSYVRALVAEGILAGNPGLIGYVFWSMLHGAISLQLADKMRPEYDIMTIIKAAHDALISGFRPQN